MKHLVLAFLVACGGGDGDPACVVAADCPAPDICETATCTAGACGVEPAAIDSEPAEVEGDCKRTQCDGEGNAIDGIDDADAPASTECAAASCLDGEKVFASSAARTACETDKLCDGAGNCVECLNGGDCDSAVCTGVLCEAIDCSASAVTHLLISEMRARGTGGSTDDFVELYNPTDAAITLSPAFAIEFRADTAQLYSTHFVGANQVVPAHGHFLIVGGAYNDATALDGNLLASFGDQGSLVLKQNGIAIDALCFVTGTTTLDNTYVCDGTPITREDVTVPQDVSAHRKPNGALGNCADHTDTVFDWAIGPSAPQNAASAATP